MTVLTAAALGLLPCTPVPRSPPAVRESDDLDRAARNAIYHRKRIAPENEAARSEQEARPAFRGFGYFLYGPVYLSQERCSSGRISFEVPVISRARVAESLWMKLYGTVRHQRLCIARRASDQGTGRTFPSSRSFKRFAISDSQAASASASTVSSRLSRSEPARAARASDGNFRASSSNFAVSVAIGIV